MNPAFSVIFLTTLIGSGQGLFIALIAGQPYQLPDHVRFVVLSCVVSSGLMGLGLVASFFHLGRPERAWRAVSQWKTSWLSREVIILPIAMILVIVFGYLHWQVQWAGNSMVPMIGWLGVGIVLLLYGCTAMIYVCIKFIQEWATPLTLINFLILGLSSGFLLATALADHLQVPRVEWFRLVAVILIMTGLVTRSISFYRNSRIRTKSTLQSAIGIKHRKISQRSMGHTGGSFNTRAFFHHCSSVFVRNIRIFVVLTVFVLPVILLILSAFAPEAGLLWGAALMQYAGLIAERWLFFAEANHPQNIYYQTVS